MLSKTDLLNRLREHPLFKAALASVDPQQSKRIAAIAESFLGEAADGLVPMIAQVTDPSKASMVNEAVLNQEPISSGSRDG